MQISPQSQKNLGVSHQQLANTLRILAVDAVEKARSGHPGMPMGMADVATVLFRDFLKFNPHDAHWPDRDRFILSAGHGSMLLYSLLYLTGYPDMTLEQLQNFRQWGSYTAGHPEYGHAAGIETTTGPLGQGIATSVGMAIAEKILETQYGSDLVNHYTYVFASDGDLMEGVSHEAISLAGHLRLSKLVVFFDDNHISIDGPTSLAVSDDQLARFKASHWNTIRINGHNEEEIYRAISMARQSDKPTLIACRTTIAYGAGKKAGTAAAHGAPLGSEEISIVRQNLEWPWAPFEIPEPILLTWRSMAQRNMPEYQSWQTRLSKLSSENQTEFWRRQKGELPAAFKQAIQSVVVDLLNQKPALATRQLSQKVLDALASLMPELVGGSADLTGSNNTKAQGQLEISPESFAGNYIHYGVREHGMATAMNGLALHGGFIPYGGTFLIFSDYCRPAIRLSALMGKRVIYVMTHDSIGLGEDGPTHQPIEHLAALRAIPNLNVFRPADGVEVAECWQLALETEKTPSIIALTRQNITPFRNQHVAENLCAKGAYVVQEAEGDRLVTLIGTGSEVGLALETQKLLKEKGIESAVVSMPCSRLFDNQSDDYREFVLNRQSLRVSIEAASPLGWEKYVGEDGMIFGLNHFGASAPYKELYRHFGLTAEVIAQKIEAKLNRK